LQKDRASVITSPNGMGCVGRRPAHARVHRAQRRLSANQAGRYADLVILGTVRRPLVVQLVPGLFVELPQDQACVDIDPQELGRNYPPTLGIIADAKCSPRSCWLVSQRAADLDAQFRRVAHRPGGARVGEVRVRTSPT
jgi:thiamine pyrophosphate-dependent acetolactate synthase large subunit-like protein